MVLPISMPDSDGHFSLAMRLTVWGLLCNSHVCHSYWFCCLTLCCAPKQRPRLSHKIDSFEEIWTIVSLFTFHPGIGTMRWWWVVGECSTCHDFGQLSKAWLHGSTTCLVEWQHPRRTNPLTWPITHTHTHTHTHTQTYTHTHTQNTKQGSKGIHFSIFIRYAVPIARKVKLH